MRTPDQIREYYELERRDCINPGCRESFRVLPTSRQEVCALQCPYTPDPIMQKRTAARRRKAAGRVPSKWDVRPIKRPSGSYSG